MASQVYSAPSISPSSKQQRTNTREVTSSPPPSLPTTPSPPMPNAVPRKPIEYSCLPEPVFPNALPEPLPSPGCVSFGPRPSSPAWSLAGSGARDRATPSQEDDTGLSLLFGVEPDRKAEPPRLRRHQSPSFIIQCLPSAPSDMLSQIPGGDRAVSETSSVHPQLNDGGGWAPAADIALSLDVDSALWRRIMRLIRHGIWA